MSWPHRNYEASRRRRRYPVVKPCTMRARSAKRGGQRRQRRSRSQRPQAKDGRDSEGRHERPEDHPRSPRPGRPLYGTFLIALLRVGVYQLDRDRDTRPKGFQRVQSQLASNRRGQSLTGGIGHGRRIANAQVRNTR